ncbi:hypothetical protein SLS64_011292 [Diaporthe eres]|uniref:Xylanolytic transcriptional activator regulatory domain-containing protein n=1 Tax=Diaporthe eres TaxID=83184 RepID=A0ABR1P8Z5_DIAER
MPTFRVTNYPRSPELVLALLAVGAQYRYEYSRALSLYRSGRAIVLGRMQSGELSSVGHIGPPNLPSERRSREDGASVTTTDPVDTFGAILLLSTFASWQGDPALVRESLEYQHLLARLARDCGLCEEQPLDVDGDADGDDWLEWVPRESSRRTKFSVSTFLNLQSIALGLPPVLLSNEINLRLPTSCRQWLAQDQQSWLAAREETPQATYFRDVLCRLCTDSGDDDGLDHGGNKDTEPMPVTTPFGNFVLIHALLQRLVLSWQFSHTSCLPTSSSALSSQKPLHLQHHPNGSGGTFEKSLRRWRDSWQNAPECLLDLMKSKDSLSWSATSLLGLAHVRVHFDLGSRRSELLHLNDPSSSRGVIADVALAAPSPVRGPHLLNALLHSVHALSVPAQLGIHYLANCHAFFLSLQHAFCYFECAVFLSKWLLSLCGDDDRERVVTDSDNLLQTWSVRW